jgi:competence protein ComEC
MKKDRIFLSSAIGFVGGVGISSLFYIGALAALYLLVAAGAVLVISLFLINQIENKKYAGYFILLSVFLIMFSIGIFRYDISPTVKNSPYQSAVDTKVKGTGLVSDEPDERENNTLLTVTPENSKEKLLLITTRYPRYAYGDTISFEGTLERPESFETQGGKIFDYPSYLAKNGIYFLINRPKITLLKPNNGNFIKRDLFLLKDSFMNSAGYYIPEPEISLLGGLLVGAKHGLSQEAQDYLRNAGIIHIIVLSGYNITIVAEAIMRLFAFFSLRLRLILGAIAIILFSVMTGGSATVVRASLMALLVLVARATGRTYAISRALIAAGVLMILFNPKILVFDPSFQLSFLATLGLVYMSPTLQNYFAFVPNKFQIKEFLVSTISTQILVTPLLLHMSGKFSLVSLVTNMLVLPIIPLTMLLGFVTGGVGYVSHTLSMPFSYATYFLLQYILGVAHFLGSLSYAAVTVSYFPNWLFGGSYLLIAVFVFMNRKKLLSLTIDKKRV